MEIGVLVALGYDAGKPEFLEKLGPALEERGFESLWVPEHVVLVDKYCSAYPYTADGRAPIPSDLGLLDPFVALTYVAAQTATLRLGTGICIVGQRNPVYTAKQVADLDVLSSGRVEFGIGLGWLREEYQVLNVPWERRGSRVDEYLQVMKTLWMDEVSSHRSEIYDLPDCRMYPKPTQRPHPNIHVGGESDAALRRAMEHGQGWFGMSRTPSQVHAMQKRLNAVLDERGDSRGDLTLTISPPVGYLTREIAAHYTDLGVDRLIVPVIARSRDDLLAALDVVAEKITWTSVA